MSRVRPAQHILEKGFLGSNYGSFHISRVLWKCPGTEQLIGNRGSEECPGFTYILLLEHNLSTHCEAEERGLNCRSTKFMQIS